jgi:hypothetical protein
MKLFVFIVTFLFSYHLSVSQANEPLEVVQNLFKAMETSDQMLASKCFVDDAILYTVSEKDGTTQLSKIPAQALTEAFGNNQNELWQEPIWNEKIEKDGRFASVWVDYAFYRNGSLSHCGVDAFHLVQLDEIWKIFHLTDTRRQNCQIPENIKEVYEK